mgnify:CR=1 FL=1
MATVKSINNGEQYSEMQKRKIMIVEDEIIPARVMERILQSWGYEVCCLASSLEDAITAAYLEEPDAIIMDVKINGRADGLEAARYIKTHFDTPIVFMSGYPDEIIKREAEPLSIGYMVKPVDFQKLKNLMESIWLPGTVYY